MTEIKKSQLKVAFEARCQDVLDNGYEELFIVPGQKSENTILRGLMLESADGRLFPERVGGSDYWSPFMNNGTPVYKNGRRERIIRCLPSAGKPRFFLRKEGPQL